jgi:sorting nexin-25
MIPITLLFYSKVTFDGKELNEILKEDLWIATQKFVERLRKIDAPKIIAVDCVSKVTNHLERIRLMKEHDELTFKTSTYLQSDEKEIEFLKKISEIVVILLLPRGYSIVPLKNLLCEIIAYKVFYSTIKIVTNPDYVNSKIVEVIQSHLASIAFKKKSFEYASSFKDFIKIIENSQSIDELLQMRASIINDLMVATTTQNLQRAKGIDIEVGSSSIKRCDINAALKLKKFIQQLSYAKNQVEGSLEKLGWVGNCSNDLNLSLQDILSTIIGRKYFTVFLESLNAGNLVGFYTSVEELKTASKSSIHQVGAEIFYAFIRPNFEIKLDKQEQKKLEGFLLGDDSNHEVFFDIQKNVLNLLQEKYYQPFIMSEEYKKMKSSIATEDVSNISSTSFIKTNFDANIEEEEDDFDAEMELTNHSTYAKNKLEQLQERLKTKKNAFEALKGSLKPDSQVLSILEKDIENLKTERRQLESHLLRTEMWSSNLGKWRAQVESVEIPESKDTPEFLIVVQAEEMPREAKEDETFEQDENISSGWVVLRTLDDFHELHKKIRPLCTELRSLDLPSNNHFILFFGKNDKGSLEKAKMQIQRYLNVSFLLVLLVRFKILFKFQFM